MSTDIDRRPAQEATTFPIHRILPGLARDPLSGFADIGRRANGEIVRLNIGAFRPYLVTRPAHVQHVLQDNAANYRREGLMWKPLSRLVGQPSDSDPAWPIKREVFHSLLSGPNIASFTDAMARTITETVDELADRAGDGRAVDAGAEMTRVVYRAITRVFVGDRISISDIDELGRAVVTASASSFRSRMLLPFVPHSIPLPGDRAFHRAVQDVDDLIFPIVRESRRQMEDGNDIMSMLLRAQDDEGNRLNDQQVRDGIVALFMAGTETTVTALTFLWPVLDAHPEVAAKLYAEIHSVVGKEQPSRAHPPKMTYTKLVLQELLRMYAIAWITPRTASADDVIDGVRIKGGSTVIVSPFLTHRLDDVWPQPQIFDPQRFAPGRSRHRFAYLAFGAGPHQCLGRVFFTIEAQLILAAFSRYRPRLRSSPVIEPQVGFTLKPRERVEIALRPAG
ncbi:MAG TPA: cytochrome P450 [Streptosporangiaceae bacterium]